MTKTFASLDYVTLRDDPSATSGLLTVLGLGPWDGQGAVLPLEGMRAVMRAGSNATLFLAGDGVAWAVPTPRAEITELAELGATVMVDQWSARQRGLDDLGDSERISWASPIDIAGLVADPDTTVVWR
jgi:hypothetical protein